MQKPAGTLKLFGLAAVAAVGAGSVALYTVKHDPNPTQVAAVASLSAAAKPDTRLIISDDKKVVSHEGQSGKTALEVLQSLAKVKTERSSFGEFVTEINGIEADGIQQLWAFYIDGDLANEEAQTYKTNDSEHIEWRVENIE